MIIDFVLDEVTNETTQVDVNLDSLDLIDTSPL